MSGEITITPAKQFGPGELETRAGLNQLGTPIGRVNEGAIGARELTAEIGNIVSAGGGHNLFCNGDFNLRDYGVDPLTGVISGGQNHDLGIVNRWVLANDTNRTATTLLFSSGQTEVPDFPIRFLRWTQAANVAADPSYMGQRLENVYYLAAHSVTFSIWVRSADQLTVIPVLRQYFGPFGSADVVTPGDAVALVANTWTKIIATFDVPNVAGKNVISGNFTELRIEVPQIGIFQIDFAHAQLEFGTAASRFEPRTIGEDVAFAQRYYEVIGFVLSDDITVCKPFANFRAVMARTPGVTLVPASGTGGTVAAIETYVTQAVDHSAIVTAVIKANAELYDS